MQPRFQSFPPFFVPMHQSDLPEDDDDYFYNLPVLSDTFMNKYSFSVLDRNKPEPVLPERYLKSSTPAPAHDQSMFGFGDMNSRTDTFLYTSPPMDLHSLLSSGTKFSGLSTDNASRFLTDFEAYIQLYHLDDPLHDRQVPTFYLLLHGPARIWFNSLPNATKNSWRSLRSAFRNKYIQLDASHPTLILESACFQNMNLSPGEPLEDFYARLVDKGHLVGKKDADILNKFISSLPEQLAFFVRAGAPKNSSSALDAAKMGEAYGYRQHPPSVSSLFPGDAAKCVKNDENKNEIQKLQQDISDLTSLFHSALSNNQAFVRKPDVNRNSSTSTTHNQCFKCQGRGHLQKSCNWNGQGVLSPDVKCQLCSQYGHVALFCKTLSLNFQAPGTTRHAFPGN